MAAVIMPPPNLQFFDDNGDPLAGGFIYTYAAGTTTPKATYTDAGGLTALPNPVPLDAAGRPDPTGMIWVDGSYKFIIKNSAGVQVGDVVDNVSSFNTSGSSINSLLPSQTGNAGKGLITDGVNASWGLLNLSLGVTGVLPGLNAPVGSIVQNIYSEYLTNANLSTVIPIDDTIPQITEGTEILTASITPKSTTNRVRISFQGFGMINTNGVATAVALFVDSTANALAAAAFSGNNADGQDLTLLLDHTPGSVSARTYRIRIGPASGIFRLNGTPSGRLFGGVARTTLTVEEIVA